MKAIAPAIVLFTTLFTPLAHGQISTRVISDGTAMIDAAPDRLRVFLSRSYEGATVTDAAERALAFERLLAQALTDMDLTPLQQEPAGIILHHQPSPTVQIGVRLWVGLGTGGALSERASEAAQTVEALRKLAVALRCEMVLEGLEVSEAEQVEEEALARATENALYHADAVGSVLGARVSQVEEVEVLSVTWRGLNPAQQGVRIGGDISCEARVRVTYLYVSDR